MTRKTKSIFLSSITACLLIMVFSYLGYAEESDYHFAYAIHYNEDKTHATLAFEMDKVNSVYINDAQVSLASKSVDIKENGTYTISVEFGEEGNIQSEHYQVTIDELAKEEERGLQLVPDVNFYNFLVESKRLDPNFTKEDLATIKNIHYMQSDPSKRIASIQGVEYMSALEYIYLNDQNIDSIEPFRNGVYENLRQMEFCNWNTGTNRIHDFSVLTQTRFPVLNGQVMFNNNGIDDRAFATLPQNDGIRNANFHFENNAIKNINVLEFYTDATQLNFKHNQIEDISVLSKLNNIINLDLSNNAIEDVSALASIATNASTKIYLNNNHVLDVSSLSSFTASFYARKGAVSEDPYIDVSKNFGQTMKEAIPLLGDKNSGKVVVVSPVIKKDGSLAAMNLNGETLTSIELYLDPATDNEVSYTVQYNENNVFYYASITQNIVWKSEGEEDWDNPSIYADTLEVFVDEVFEPLDSIHAQDYLGADISQSIEYLSSILSFETAGSYEIEYEVMDRMGYTTQYKRLVNVNSRPMIEASAQKYEEGNTNYDQSILYYANAYFMQAPGVVGEKAKHVDLDNSHIAYTIFSEDNVITNDNLQAGLYTIEYYMQDSDEYKSTLRVPLLICRKNSVMDALSNYTIGAQDIHVDSSKLEQLTPATAIQQAQVQAYFLRKGAEDELVDFENMSDYVHVHPQQWANILHAPNDGGVFPLQYILNVNGYELSIQTNVIVHGNALHEETSDSMHLLASDFSITYEEAPSFSEEHAYELSNFTIVGNSNVDIRNFSLLEEELVMIQKSGELGGEYPLTLMYEEKGEVASVEVHVLINEKEQQDVVLSGDEYIDGSEASMNTSVGLDINDIQIGNGNESKIATSDTSRINYFICACTISFSILLFHYAVFKHKRKNIVHILNFYCMFLNKRKLNCK